MPSSFISAVVGLAFTFLLPPLADGQDRGQSDRRRADTSALEKRIVELEGKLSAVTKEVEELRREVRAQSSLAVVPLRGLDAKDAVKVIRTIYRGRPGLEVTTLANAKLVIIRADEKTKGEIVNLLHSLELSEGKKEAVQRAPIPQKAASGKATAKRLIFPEDIERAMLMEAWQIHRMEQVMPMEIDKSIKVPEWMPPAVRKPQPTPRSR